MVLDAGRIVEQGTHAELVEHRGLDAELWSRQSGGFLGTAGERTARSRTSRQTSINNKKRLNHAISHPVTVMVLAARVSARCGCDAAWSALRAGRTPSRSRPHQGAASAASSPPACAREIAGPTTGRTPEDSWGRGMRLRCRLSAAISRSRAVGSASPTGHRDEHPAVQVAPRPAAAFAVQRCGGPPPTEQGHPPALLERTAARGAIPRPRRARSFEGCLVGVSGPLGPHPGGRAQRRGRAPE
jgi:hypothetical protein